MFNLSLARLRWVQAGSPLVMIDFGYNPNNPNSTSILIVIGSLSLLFVIVKFSQFLINRYNWSFNLYFLPTSVVNFFTKVSLGFGNNGAAHIVLILAYQFVLYLLLGVNSSSGGSFSPEELTSITSLNDHSWTTSSKNGISTVSKFIEKILIDLYLMLADAPDSNNNTSDTVGLTDSNNASDTVGLTDSNNKTSNAETAAGVSRPPSPGFGDFAESLDNKLAENHPQINLKASDGGTLLQGALGIAGALSGPAGAAGAVVADLAIQQVKDNVINK